MFQWPIGGASTKRPKASKQTDPRAHLRVPGVGAGRTPSAACRVRVPRRPVTGSRALRRRGTRARRHRGVVAGAVTAIQAIQATTIIIITTPAVTEPEPEPEPAAACRRRRPQEIRVRRSRSRIGARARQESLDVLWRALSILRLRVVVVLPAVFSHRRAAALRRRAGRRRRRRRGASTSSSSAAAAVTARPIPIPRTRTRTRKGIGVAEPLLDLGELRGRRVARGEARVRVRVRRREAVLAHVRRHVRRPRRHQAALALTLSVNGAARGRGRGREPRARARAWTPQRSAPMRELVGARARVRALKEAAFVAELFVRSNVRLRERRGGGEKSMNFLKKEAK